MTETGPSDNGVADAAVGDSGHVTDPKTKCASEGQPDATESGQVPAAIEQSVAADAVGGLEVGELTGLSIGGIAKQADWSAHVETLDRWRQGHLLTGLPVTWTAPPGLDPITGEELTGDMLGPLYDPSELVPGIICTQTCDLGGKPPGDLHPFFQIAPLVRGDQLSSNLRSLASGGRIGYLVPVETPFPEPEPEPETEPEPEPEGAAGGMAGAAPPRKTGATRWFADLRIQFPLSKAVLLDRDPIAGFADDEDYLKFANTLAYKVWRPALHDSLSDALPELLMKFLRETGAKLECFVKVDEVRILILDGDRLNPKRANLFVLTEGVALDTNEKEVWGRFQAQAAALLRQHGITLSAMVHTDISQLSALKYRTSSHVPCLALGFQRYL